MKNNLFDNFVKQQLSGYGEDVPAHLWNNISLDNQFKNKFSNYQPEVPAHIWENIKAKTGMRPAGFWFNLKKGQIAAAILILLALLGGGGAYFMHLKNIGEATDNFSQNAASYKNTTSVAGGGSGKIKFNSKTRTTITGGSPATETADVNNSNGENLHAATTNKYSIPGMFQSSISAGDAASDAATSPDDATHSDIYTNPLTPFNHDISVNKFSMLFKPGLLIPMLPKSPTIPCPPAEKDAAGSKRYFEVYAGPDYVFRNFSDTSNSAYRQKREASSKVALSYSAGIRYTRVFGSGMSVRSGLNYSQINEKFTKEQGRITQNVYIINSQGDTTGSYSVTGTQYSTSTNKYRTLDIPVVVGYELGNGKWHANVNAGAIINLYSKQTGYVLDKNGNAIDISSGNSSSAYHYKTNAGVSVTGGVSVYYKLNDQLHVMAEPYIRYSLTPVTKSELSLKEKFHTGGLRLGLRLDF